MPDPRFLFLLYYYPPALGTAAKRNRRISNAISEKVQAIIFTSSIVSKEPISSEQLRIETIPSFDYRKILRRHTKDGALPESKKKNTAIQWIIKLINTFPFNIIAGEGGLIYLLNLLREGSKAIRSENITHLYSSYRPFTDHYAAYLLKKRHPEVFWIADFRDLLIDPHYNHILFATRHQSFFKKIFSKADLLTTVSDGLAKHLLDYNKNVVTTRNGIEGPIVNPLPVETSSFTIAYTGSMFLDKRNAEPLFLALQQLLQETKMEGADIRIIYAGKDGSYWNLLADQYHFETLFDDHGIVSAAEAQEIQHAACINLLLTVSSADLQGVLTGKMIEYFESGSPVLGIVVGQNDHELQTLLKEVEIGNIFSDHPDSLEAIKSFILLEYNHWKNTGKNRKPVNVDVLRKRYSTEVVMEPLFMEMKKLSAISYQPSAK